ncbi:cutinase family protein [Mycobacterium sp. SMC-8]|uniref:cutinase family protein n=1 Tax=Mycobacterium sp. SMC-8 TaxID=2857060 RepID=UPI0021B28E43|nr:cutinase family protein [Mycobacterium sp. SMC-8]UXA11217.1 cutinase family protein [Mycobacterium sp. SMC-8]
MTVCLRTLGRLVGAMALAVAALPIMIPVAGSQPCPDIGVVFARGTAEPPGVGGVGQRFVDALRAQVVPRTVGVHGVNYPASNNFTGGSVFTMNVAAGVRDEADHLRGVVSACPNTHMILGGYSQGAVVTALTTSGVLPAGVPAGSAPLPIPADVADNVAAVVLFGMPAGWSAVKYGAPDIDVGPAYAARALELCAPGDTVCSGAPPSGSSAPHQQYAVNGMADQAATFAVGQLANHTLNEPFPQLAQ